MRVFGINPVAESLNRGSVVRLFTAPGSNARVGALVDRARAAGIPVESVNRAMLDGLAGGGVHQNVAAEIRPPEDVSVRDLVETSGAAPLIVVLDGVEDPQNVGAIVRSVDAAGGHGVVRQARRAAPLTGAASKASAGAVSYVPVATVVNIARALEELKAAGVWTVGLAGEAPRRYDELDYTLPTAFVLGGEGVGLRRLVRERCDWLVSIPMGGRVTSLNVAAAAAVSLFEAARQRRRASSTGT